jgi:FtsH-binding integral membrane protein
LWNTVDKKVRGYESRPGGAPRRTFARFVYEWLAKPCLGAAMALWAVQGVVAEHQLLVELFSWCVAMVAAVAARRVKSIRHVAMGYATVWIFYLLSALVLVLAFGWKV